jgi:hypothetical protein
VRTSFLSLTLFLNFKLLFLRTVLYRIFKCKLTYNYADPDLHLFGNPDLDSDQSVKQDPDPHQSQKADPDPHQSQNCYEGSK